MSSPQVPGASMRLRTETSCVCLPAGPGDCVMGGGEAVAHSRPYMASIQHDDKHECGGFLISGQWVMTAAHCFSEPSDKSIRVVLGAHSLSTPEDSKQVFSIASSHPHPEFSLENYDNDIALLKLDGTATESSAVKPIAFQRGGGYVQEGEECSIAGWGATSNIGFRPDKLQQVDVKVLSRRLCGRSDYYGDKFTDNMMCAAESRKDTCDGDSGGPLVHSGVAVGITSNGSKKCGRPKKPGVYTVISRYAQWIDSTMQQ
uniref:Complement factor D (adipsin) n=2 Tax=Lepisosteus oculatus TaxID=7918 RepID=W5MCQ9_LEPOC